MKKEDFKFNIIFNLIKNNIIQNTIKNLKEDYHKVNIIFKNNINTDDNLFTYGKKEKLATCILSNNIYNKIIICYNISTLINILSVMKNKNTFIYIIKIIKEITRHECYHVKQFLWLKENTKNWENTMYELMFYQIRTPYSEREYEKEAKKIEFGKINEIKSFESYLSQFVYS